MKKFLNKILCRLRGESDLDKLKKNGYEGWK